ncbi:MAG: NfeD family protein [Acidimicrobiales bacterium]
MRTRRLGLVHGLRRRERGRWRLPLRRLRMVAVLCLVAAAALGTALQPTRTPAAGAATDTTGTGTFGTGNQASNANPGTTDLVEVVEVSGLLDPVLADFVRERIVAANRDGLVALVLRLNSPGSVLSVAEFQQLATELGTSPVPVAIWVGPSSAQARGAAAQLVGLASPGGIASGARVGQAGEQLVDRDRFGVLFGDAANQVRSAYVRFDDAESANLVPAATLGDFIIGLEGVATRAVQVDGQTRREPDTPVRFVQLGLAQELLHTVASPSVAYLLFVIGLGLILFELFTAGIGLAGLVAAIFTLLGCYGLAVLPARWWAVGLLLLTFPVLAIDVQIGVPRRATAAGFALFTLGTFTLFEGVSLSWVTIASAAVLMVVVYLRGMPAMVRTRFSAVDLGRDWLVGEQGTVTSDMDPRGIVAVRSATWPASTSGGALSVGDRVTVTGTRGHVLEVTAVTD